MGTRKIRGKAKKAKPRASGPPVRRRVRLRKKEAMELNQLSHEETLDAAKQHLRFLRPRLDEVAVHEVAWRCADPAERGGIETGTDAEGEYADVAVTE